MNLVLAQQTVLFHTGLCPLVFVELTEGPGLRVDWEDEKAKITAEDQTALTRAWYLICLAHEAGQDSLHVEERRRFAHCGAMLDMSRNGVMNADALKRWIDIQAALGLNMLMLYTEDTYEVPEYPYFGYLRGRYTQEELQALDEYAARRGVELVPCVQTLAHLQQFLQWPSSAPLRDQKDILLIDSEDTYRFLDAALASLSRCFRSRRIHIGMDEAHGVGLGNYLLKHGFTDRFALLNRHLARVTALCEKYGFKPMMWSDMFFRLGSATNTYYDPHLRVPDEVIAALPPVEQVYWDYYHEDEATYERMLREHRRMGRGTVFAGGIWTWSGFLPNRQRTLKTMVPALRVNARQETDTVFATLWGDDGAETDYLLAAESLALYAEACWTGPDFDPERCERTAAPLAHLSREVRECFDRFYADDYTESTGKMLLWCDPLYPCGVSAERKDCLLAAAEEAVAVLKQAESSPETVYARRLFKTLSKKIRALQDIRAAYDAEDRKKMETLAAQDLPALAKAYDALMAAHRALWEQNRKRQGWEVLALRYGGASMRLLDAADALHRWAAGELSAVAELAETELPDGKGSHYDRVSTPSAKT